MPPAAAPLLPLLLSLASAAAAWVSAGCNQPVSSMGEMRVPRPMRGGKHSQTSYATVEYVYSGGLQAMDCSSIHIDSAGFCDSGGSYLILEWWAMEADGQAVNSLTTIQGVYFIASSRGDPEVALDAVGELIEPPPLGTVPAFDALAVNNSRPYQRITIPVSIANSQAMGLDLTVGNFGRYLDGYMIRASCATLPICPRTSPEEDECGGETHGQCFIPDVSSNSQQYVCRCLGDYVDYGCNAIRENLTADSSNIQLLLPPQTWAYYSVDLLNFRIADPGAALLVELSQPFGSFSSASSIAAAGGQGVQGALVLSPRIWQNRSGLFPTYMFPTYSDLNLNQITRRVPMMDPDYVYMFKGNAALQSVPSVWIGVFNAAPRPARPQQSGPLSTPLTLRVRWTTSIANGTGTTPICPHDCNGRGMCLFPIDVSSRAGYSCQCQSGYGGPWCEAPQLTVTASSSHPFSTGNGVELGPKQRTYFVVNLQPTAQSARSDTIQVSWTTGDAGVNGLWMISSPIFSGESTGEVYFDAANTIVRSSPSSFQASALYVYNVYSWVVVVYNAGNSPGTFALDVSIIVNASNTTFHWQLGILIGAGSLLGMLGISFIVTRFLALRGLFLPTPRTGDVELGEGHRPGTSIPMERGSMVAVPADVVTTFPLFKYGRPFPDHLGDHHNSDAGSGASGGGGGSTPAVEASGRDVVPDCGHGTAETYTPLSTVDRDSQLTGYSPAKYPAITPASGGGTGSVLVSDSGAPRGFPESGPPGSEVSVALTSANGACTSASLSNLGIRCPNPSPPATTVVSFIPCPHRAGAGPPREGGGGHGRQVHPNGGVGSGGHAVDDGSASDTSECHAEESKGAATSDSECRAEASNVGPAPDGTTHNDDLCSICIVEYAEGETLRQLPCRHYFHQVCIDQWMQRNSSCPICRKVLVDAGVLEAALEREQHQRSEERTRRRQARRLARHLRQQQQQQQQESTVTDPATASTPAACSAAAAETAGRTGVSLQ